MEKDEKLTDENEKKEEQQEEKQEEQQEESQQQEDEKSDESESEEELVPASSFKGVRDKYRIREDRLMQENDDLRRQLAERTPPPSHAEKSPLEIFAEEYGDIAPTAKVLIEQGKWERVQMAMTTQQKAKQQQIDDYNEGIRDATLNITDAEKGEGLGFATIQAMGQGLLTRGDHLDIFEAGKNAGKVAYQRLLHRIMESNTPAATELKKRISSRRAKPKPKETQPKDKKDEPEGEAPEVELRPSTSEVVSFIFG